MVTSDLKSSSGRSNQVKFLFVVVVFFLHMARNSGQRNGARAGLLGNMAAKHSKEMYGRNKTK